MDDGTKSTDHVVKKSRKQAEKEQQNKSKKRKVVESAADESEEEGLNLSDSIRKSMSRDARKKLDKAMAKLEA